MEPKERVTIIVSENGFTQNHLRENKTIQEKEDLHGGAHGVEEVDDDEGEDGQPLLPCEGGKRRHSCVLLLNGLKIKDAVKQLDSPC